ncbi:MAG: MBL fold metallo-hydrolase [Clostridiales bacterium]|nr:MBL fold metallo-hydrolase [Clostridiales bacterium]
MKITVLTENSTANENLIAEHGLSLFIQTNDKNILFDFGQTETALDNANKLGINLNCIDIAILSHGHYDHSGAIKKFLTLNDKAPVVMHKNCFNDHFNGTEKYIGIDKSLLDSDRLVLIDNDLKIDNDLSILVSSKREVYYPIDSNGLNVCRNGEFIPDDFTHEIYLMIGDILISGCSHRGILNILKQFEPRVFIGGLHLVKYEVGGEKLSYIASEIDKHPTVIYSGHCTGEEQYSYLKTILKNKLYPLSTGLEYKL